MLIKHHFVNIYTMMQKEQNKPQHIPQLFPNYLPKLMSISFNLHKMHRVMQQLEGHFTIRYTEICTRNFSFLLSPILYQHAYVLQGFPTTPMQQNQIYMHPNLHMMPLCAPQVFWQSDWPEQNFFHPLFKLRIINIASQMGKKKSKAYKFEQCC